MGKTINSRLVGENIRHFRLSKDWGHRTTWPKRLGIAPEASEESRQMAPIASTSSIGLPRYSMYPH